MIPKIIHHIAPKDRNVWHPVWDRCYPTWLEHFPEPEYEHKIWFDDNTIDNLVCSTFPHYSSYYVDLRHIQKIDIAKMVMIYVFGGVYADMDYYCKTNFFDDLCNRVVVSGSPHHNETIQNGLMASEKEHPFVLEYIRDMFDNVKKIKMDKSDDYVKDTTGPFALEKTYQKNKQFWTDIQVLDPDIYNPTISTFYHENEMSGVKCIHLLTGWWGKEARTGKKRAGKGYQDWRKIMIHDI